MSRPVSPICQKWILLFDSSTHPTLSACSARATRSAAGKRRASLTPHSSPHMSHFPFSRRCHRHPFGLREFQFCFFSHSHPFSLTPIPPHMSHPILPTFQNSFDFFEFLTQPIPPHMAHSHLPRDHPRDHPGHLFLFLFRRSLSSSGCAIWICGRTMDASRPLFASARRQSSRRWSMPCGTSSAPRCGTRSRRSSQSCARTTRSCDPSPDLRAVREMCGRSSARPPPRSEERL